MRSWKLLPLLVSGFLLVGCSAGLDGERPSSEPTPTPTPSDQPVLSEAEAVRACVDEWREGATSEMPSYKERWNELYSTDRAVTSVVDGEWRITLVPSERPTGEWNLYCVSNGPGVQTADVGYEQWPG